MDDTKEVWWPIFQLFPNEEIAAFTVVIRPGIPIGLVVCLERASTNAHTIHERERAANTVKWIGLNGEEKIISGPHLTKSFTDTTDINLCNSTVKKVVVDYEGNILILLRPDVGFHCSYWLGVIDVLTGEFYLARPKEDSPQRWLVHNCEQTEAGLFVQQYQNRAVFGQYNEAEVKWISDANKGKILRGLPIKDSHSLQELFEQSLLLPKGIVQPHQFEKPEEALLRWQYSKQQNEISLLRARPSFANRLQALGKDPLPPPPPLLNSNTSLRFQTRGNWFSLRLQSPSFFSGLMLHPWPLKPTIQRLMKWRSDPNNASWISTYCGFGIRTVRRAAGHRMSEDVLIQISKFLCAHSYWNAGCIAIETQMALRWFPFWSRGAHPALSTLPRLLRRSIDNSLIIHTMAQHEETPNPRPQRNCTKKGCDGCCSVM